MMEIVAVGVVFLSDRNTIEGHFISNKMEYPMYPWAAI